MEASPIPQAFVARKSAILAALAAPAEEYTDRSPKGSVDAGIRNLIALLNGIEGIVTTSSCAGRVSLFAEGTSKASAANSLFSNPTGRDAEPLKPSKGLGGRWLFVTHDPEGLEQLPARIAALRDEGGAPAAALQPSSTAPLIRLQFEPMVLNPLSDVRPHLLSSHCRDHGDLRGHDPSILHVQAASLAHARPILAAAVVAGYRESGVNSLRCLDDKSAYPVVGVRSAGLGLGGVVGYVEPATGRLHWCVEALYVEWMANMFRERFAENLRRIERFEKGVRRSSLVNPATSMSRGRKQHEAARDKTPAGEARRVTRDEASEDELSIYDGLESLELY